MPRSFSFDDVFAWYQAAAATATVSSGSAGGDLTVSATATDEAISVKIEFSLTLPKTLEPTLESDGKVYVVSNGVVKVANPQPSAEKRYGEDGTMAVSALKNASTDEALTYEDARGLDGHRYKIEMVSSGGDGALRVNSAKTNAADGNLDRVTNAASKFVVGYVTIAADGVSAPSYTYTNSAKTVSTDPTFCYAYNPVDNTAAGSSASADAFPVGGTITRGSELTITLTKDN